MYVISSLSDPESHTSCKPQNLNEQNRYQLLVARLEKLVQEQAIICLQEVSILWASRLHTFFVNRQYLFVFGGYGSKFNGYMGVAIAIPLTKYNILDVDIAQIGGTKPSFRPFVRTWLQALIEDLIVAPLLGIAKGLGILPLLRLVPMDNPWPVVINKGNQLVSCRLKPNVNTSEESFLVGTYHMPCVYWDPKFMTIHSSLVTQYFQRLAGNHPYILTGDFNITPTSGAYQLLTTGSLPSNSPEFPYIPRGDPWLPTVTPMRSAYRLASPQGTEPPFTNYGQFKTNPPFINSLDYIFLSKQWAVDGVGALAHSIAEFSGPLPADEEPSDHLMISAALRLLD